MILYNLYIFIQEKKFKFFLQSYIFLIIICYKLIKSDLDLVNRGFLNLLNSN